MTPEEFIARWQDNPLTERAGAQAWFDDLCDLLGVDKPRDADRYCFERGARKAGGGDGWADVWMRCRFGWENKRPGRSLDAALKQLTDYSLELENPPLLVVSDRERIVIHTAFTGYPDEPREIRIEQLVDPEQRQILRWVFTDPEKLRPEKSTAAITAEAAGHFAELAAAMRRRGGDGQQVAHFLVQCLFCMFAEDEHLLPANIFTDLLGHARNDTSKAARRIEKLFHAMQQNCGEYGDHDIAWFNGGLFKTIDIPALTASDLAALHGAAADMDWRGIDPTIFGTLFERGLDPAARAPLGAHYTDTGTIAKLIDPLIREPLLAEWARTKAEIRARPKKATAAWQGFLLRLNRFRVLDPACGSGNFLYLALKALRDVEKRAHVEAQELGLPPPLNMETGPHNILGLEINEFAAELARVTVWIGDIQWCRRNGYAHAINPILKSLDGIEHRDALLNADGSEAEWPAADVIVGNPPFLGNKVMRGELGDGYVETLRRCFAGRVPGGVDFVTYWFEKSRAQIAASKLQGAGLVATNSIRGGANRKVLERIVDTTHIFEAWSDEPWVNEGAAVRVSLVAFGPIFGVDRSSRLDGAKVSVIHSDLSAAEGIDLTKAARLPENVRVIYMGVTKVGPFDVPGELARGWLRQPNPHGKSNAEVLRPSWNGLDITRRDRDVWIIDFGCEMTEGESSLFEAPFSFAKEHVFPMRQANNREAYRKLWWRHGEARPGLRRLLAGIGRYIVTPEVAKHRVFVWVRGCVLPDKNLQVIARADDTTFGILHSRFHELWSLRLGTSLEDRPRYT
ncbi:MAG TPA: N-6 DNA methylase, partial [Azonexus sp.]|nr:N-6 DNA methylase [Azonexus sp.]